MYTRAYKYLCVPTLSIYSGSMRRGLFGFSSSKGHRPVVITWESKEHPCLRPAQSEATTTEHHPLLTADLAIAVVTQYGQSVPGSEVWPRDGTPDAWSATVCRVLFRELEFVTSSQERISGWASKRQSWSLLASYFNVVLSIVIIRGRLRKVGRHT